MIVPSQNSVTQQKEVENDTSRLPFTKENGRKFKEDSSLTNSFGPY